MSINNYDDQMIFLILFRDPTPNSTNVTPVKWTPLQSGDTYDYLNINIDSRMKTFVKGKERWDWESKKNQLH